MVFIRPYKYYNIIIICCQYLFSIFRILLIERFLITRISALSFSLLFTLQLAFNVLLNSFSLHKSQIVILAFSVNIKNKQFTVWRGNNIDVGKVIAKKVQELMNVSKATFLEWYDYDREEWLKTHGY